MRIRYVAGAAFFLLGACATMTPLELFNNPQSGGTKRASFDLQCPEGQLQSVDLGGGTIGVTGCGKRAVYKWVSRVGWVNNSGADTNAQKQ